MIYYGNTDAEVGEPFSITCIIPVSEQVEWTKDGEPIKNLQLSTDTEHTMSNGKSMLMANARHAKNDYIFTESDIDENLEEGII